MRSLRTADTTALVGFGPERDTEDRTLTEMAWCFVEEYVRMGCTEEEILCLFRSPACRGVHRVLYVKGEDFLRGLIETVKTVRPETQLKEDN
jgi:hypothetical protein